MTSTAPPVTSVEWPKPGPGSWVLDLDHTGPTPSRPVRDLFAVAAEIGMREAMTMLGSPVDTMQIRFVHGRFYRRMVPAVGGGLDLPAPPAPVLWLATRLHPGMRRRERTARRALTDRVWLQELDRWEAEWRPALLERNGDFAAVEPRDLDDLALAGHLRDLWAHLEWSTALHFRLHGTDVGPLGLLLAVTDELGVERALPFAALAGSSPATNAPLVALADVRAVVARHVGRHRSRLGSVDALRALHPEVRDAVDDFVRQYGWRLTTGYDLIDRTLMELPGVLVTAMQADHARIPGLRTQADAEDRGVAATHALLAAVPTDRREEIATLLDDARRCYGLRDENGPLTYEWPAGLLRRALLAAADRLAGRGALDHRDDIFDATTEETTALLVGDPGPDADELAGRRAERMRWADLDAPAHLGPPESFPPAWTMPRGMRRLVTAIVSVMDLLATEHTEQLHGTGVGREPYVGTARVVRDVDDAFGRVEPGDVLVTQATVPTFNAVLAIAGAVVVEEGGLLSHAAVIARELGIPAVIGATDATSAIPDGATIEVDPVAGVVRVRCE